MRRYYITGTDTDAGKTVLAAALAAGAPGTVLALKPVASGVPSGPGDDSARLAAAAGHGPRTFATFRAPISPHRAALLEGRTLNADEIGRWILAHEADAVLIEGAGGWRSPLGGTLGDPFDLSDLVRRAPGDAVVAVPDRIGALHAALVVLESLERSGVPVALVVLNRGVGDASDPARAWNLADLASLVTARTGVPIAVLDRVDPDDRASLREAGRRLWSNMIPSPGRGGAR